MTDSASQTHSGEPNSPATPDAPSQAPTTCTFPCERCGADLTFRIDAQRLTCPYCGFAKALTVSGESLEEHDFSATLDRLAKKRGEQQEAIEPLNEVTCDSCAATLQFAGNLTSDHCTYCGSPLQIEHVRTAALNIPVDGVLAFRISREQARANLKAWVQSRWFAPNEFKRRGIGGRFDGVYLPYWTFDALTYTRYTGQRGEHYYVTVGSGKNRRTVRRTRWYPASGAFHRVFDDVLVVAGEGLDIDRLETLEPWPLAHVTPFNREVLAGYVARTYDVPLDQAFVHGRGRMDAAIEAEVRSRIGGDAQRIFSIQTGYDGITYKHLLLPVWMMGYRFRKKAYQVLINAGTGEVSGSRPYSLFKIIGTVLVATAVVAAIVYFTNR